MEASATKYTIKLNQFEGPLDLLLSLIESRKLFINEISLAEVTNDYINYTKNIPNMIMDDVTSFIIVAASLILIKSRSLLPGIALSTDEEEKIVDLEKRLRLYKMIKEGSESIKKLFGANQLFFTTPHGSVEPIWSPDNQITIGAMHALMQDILARIPKKEKLQEITVRKVISLEEMIDNLMERVQASIKTSFKLFAHKGEGDEKEQKVNVIVSFLAMLELVRQGILDVVQNSHFDDMELTKIDPTMSEPEN